MRSNGLLRVICLTRIACGLALAIANVAKAETAQTDTASAETPQDPVRARALGLQGVEAWERRDYSTALDKLDQAYRLHRLPTLAWWSGCVLEQMGRLVEASQRWREASHLTIDATGKEHEVQLQAQQEAEIAYSAIARRIPKLVIKVEGKIPANARLSLDGASRSIDVIGTALPLDPGDHEVQLSWADRTVTERVGLVEGRVATLVLSTEAIAAPSEDQPVQAGVGNSSAVHWDYGQYHREPSLQSILGWTAIGVGAAGLVTWGVTGAITLDRRERLQDHCRRNICSPAYQEDLDQFRRYRTASTVAFIAGLVSASAGVTLVLTATRSSGPPTALNWHGWVGPCSIGVGARY